MIVGEVVEKLIHIKDHNRSTLTQVEIDAINNACNVLSHTFNRFTEVANILDDRITSIRWANADIQHALVEDGFEPDEDNVNIILNYPGLAKYLQERGIEAGWNVIHNAISDSKNSLLVLQSDSNKN